MAQVDRRAAGFENLPERPFVHSECDGERHDHRDDAALRLGERERGLAEERIEVARACRW